jgi:hypothetical protein
MSQAIATWLCVLFILADQSRQGHICASALWSNQIPWNNTNLKSWSSYSLPPIIACEYFCTFKIVAATSCYHGSTLSKIWHKMTNFSTNQGMTWQNICWPYINGALVTRPPLPHYIIIQLVLEKWICGCWRYFLNKIKRNHCPHYVLF